MAAIRPFNNLNESINYLSALSLLCVLSCFITMLKFGGFKTTLNFGSRKKKKEGDEPGLPMIGAYRSSRDEFFAYDGVSESHKKISPSMVVLPKQPELRPNRSTSDLIKNVPVQVRQSQPNVSLNPRGDEDSQRISPKESKQSDKEQKKLQKQRETEQKAREKIAAQEAKQERSRQEKEIKEAQKQSKDNKKGKKKKNPAPQPVRANPLAQGPSVNNTLESSISKSSGPPPYTENQDKVPVRPIRSDTSSEQINSSDNISFSKPIDTGGSWDMVTQHRQQITRPTATTSRQQPKQKVMDLNYNFGSTVTNEGNSEA